jgi:multidrug efflux pump subunit AcrA (membrane-fusion protein)
MPVPAPAQRPATPVWPEAVAVLQGSGETPIVVPTAGFLVKQAYAEGEAVKAGQVLFLLDPSLAHVTVEGITRTGATLTLTSPGDGVPTRALHGPGDWLPAGTRLASLQTCDPMHAEFVLAAGTSPADLNGARATLILPDGTRADLGGQVISASPGRNGTLSVTASFPNAQGRLKPGMYVKVQLAPPPQGPVTNAPPATWR